MRQPGICEQEMKKVNLNIFKILKHSSKDFSVFEFWTEIKMIYERNNIWFYTISIIPRFFPNKDFFNHFPDNFPDNFPDVFLVLPGLCRDDPWTRFSGQCIYHLYLGDCYRKRDRMQYLCPKTCGFCRNNCVDTSEYCTFFAYYGYCMRNTKIRNRCRKTCRLC